MAGFPGLRVLSVSLTSTRSSGLPHLAGLSGPTNFRLNRMDLPCSRWSLWLHAGGTNPGSTAAHSHCHAACSSAFPFERQGRLLRSRSISGLFSRSLHSGLHPPCLRFAVAVTGHHARLGTRLLARLCRGRHFRRQSSTHLHGATLTPPCIRGRTRRFDEVMLQRERRVGGDRVSQPKYPRQPMRYGVKSLINCGRLIPRVRRVLSRICALNLSRAFGAMRRSLPSFEMLDPGTFALPGAPPRSLSR